MIGQIIICILLLLTGIAAAIACGTYLEDKYSTHDVLPSFIICVLCIIGSFLLAIQIGRSRIKTTKPANVEVVITEKIQDQGTVKKDTIYIYHF